LSTLFFDPLTLEYISPDRVAAARAAAPVHTGTMSNLEVHRGIYATPNLFMIGPHVISARERGGLGSVLRHTGRIIKRNPFMTGLLYGGFLAPSMGWWRLLVDVPAGVATWNENAWATSFTLGTLAGTASRAGVDYAAQRGAMGTLRDAIDLARDVKKAVKTVADITSNVVKYYSTAYDVTVAGLDAMFAPVALGGSIGTPGVVSGPYLPGW